MPKKSITRILLFSIASLSLALWSCKSNDDPEQGIPANACFDFATFASTAQNGTEFTLQKSGDSPIISYYTSYSFEKDTTFVPGMRLIISYLRTDGMPYTTGNIKLYGYRLLDNKCQKMLSSLPDTIPNFDSDPLTPISLTRTGQYVNMQVHFSCLKPQTPKALLLVADEATINTESPVLHLIYKAGNNGENYYNGYASFDISEMWNRDNCKDVTISYYTPDGNETYKFKKE